MKEDGKAELEQGSEQPAKKQIRLKPFSFVMLLISVVLVTAGITFIVLMAGDDKVVDVGSPIQKVDRKEFEKLYNAYDEMKKSYYETIDETAVINGAINGMIEALGDPYSDYLHEDEARQLNESISSSLEGIGAEIQESEAYIAIVSTSKNSPAERAGLLPHDKIITVAG